QLRASRVLIVGLGGLGSPVAMYLAAAGIGTLGLADFDEVDPTNLQRQILYREADVGGSKVAAAAAALRAFNAGIALEVHGQGITCTNAAA
ncbi:HesA/MoeB/ThiF family protein, partial [Klebsiella pneumoniae]